MEATGPDVSINVRGGFKYDLADSNNDKLNLRDHLKGNWEYQEFLKAKPSQRLEDVEEAVTPVKSQGFSRKRLLTTSDSSITLVNSSAELTTPVASSIIGDQNFLNGGEDFKENGNNYAKSQFIPDNWMKSSRDMNSGNNNNGTTPRLIGSQNPMSQPPPQFKLSREARRLPSHARYLNTTHSQLVKTFHFSEANRLPFCPLKKYQPPIFSDKCHHVRAFKNLGSKAWIKISTQTDERWDEISSRLLETESVPELIIDITKRMFTTSNKFVKLQILANNQILGAGNIVISTFGVPFQESKDSNLIIEAKTSLGIQKETTTEKYLIASKNGIGYNLRHILSREGEAAMHGTSTPNQDQTSHIKDENKSFHVKDEDKLLHVKRPLNSYMLYRSSMMRVCTVLSLQDSLTEIVEEILKSYRGGVVNESFPRAEQELYVLTRINDIINDPDENEAIKFIDLLNARLFVYERVKHAALGHVISALWQTESPQVKEAFHQFSRIEAAVHLLNNPGYKYKPSKKHKS